ncbi:MAG: hypothetical protein DMF74_03840, partial [Acidobacteria bacterium]
MPQDGNHAKRGIVLADRSARIARRSSLAIVLGVLAVVAACWLASIGTSEASKDAKPQIDRQITSPIQATNGKIYFDSDRDGHAQIYSINPDGSNQTRISNNTCVDADPALVEALILFVGNCSGKFQIYTMYQDGTNGFLVSDNS